MANIELSECAKEVKKAFSELSDNELLEIEKDLDLIDEVYGSDKAQRNKIVRDYVEQHAADLKYRNATIIRDKIKQIRNVKKIVEEAATPKEAGDNLLNFFEGDGGVESLYQVNSAKYDGQFRTGLKRSGVDREFASGEYDELIRIHNHKLSKGEAGLDDPVVKAIYENIKKVNDSMWEDMNLAGLDVRYRKDFLVSRNVDVNALISAGDKQYIDDLYNNLLDINEFFTPVTIAKGEAEMKRVLKNMYDDMVESRSTINLGEMDGSLGKKNYRKSLKSRKLVFKDGSAEHQYSQKYGSGKSLMEQIQLGMDRSAKTVANVTMLGTDPEMSFKKLATALDSKFKQGATKQEVKEVSNDIGRAVSKAKSAYTEIVAPPHQPTTKLDNAINFIRGLQAFSKLGSSLLTAMYDINSTTLQYAARTAESQAKAYMESFKEFVNIAKMSNLERKELGEMLNTQVWFNDIAVVLGGHKGDYDTKFDAINNFFTKTYNFTGVPFQTELSRLTNAVLQAKAFTKMLKKGYDNLNPLQKLAADEYGMTAQHFDFINKLGATDPQLGMVTPKNIREIDIVKVKDFLGTDSNNQAMKFVKEVHDSYSMYINDAVQKGTPTPTAKTKRQMFKSRDHNELVRSVANLTMQFKETAWKIAISNYDAFSKYNKAFGGVRAGKEVGMYMTMGFTSYIMFENARRMLFNQPSVFEEFEKGDQKTMRNLFFDYVNKSSIAPVISDTIEAGTSPYMGRNIQQTLLGPTFSMAQDAFNIIKDPSRKNIGKGLRHITPANYLPLKSALRHSLEYDLWTGQKIRK